MMLDVVINLLSKQNKEEIIRKLCDHSRAYEVVGGKFKYCPCCNQIGMWVDDTDQFTWKPYINSIVCRDDKLEAQFKMSQICHFAEIDEGDIGEMSDGYHTFNDLYMQKMYLAATIVSLIPERCSKARKHHTGEECFGGGWFLVSIDTSAGMYGYHFEDKYWDLFPCKETEYGPEWDGYTDKDVARLLHLHEVMDAKVKKVNDGWMSPEEAEQRINERCHCNEEAEAEQYKQLVEGIMNGFHNSMTYSMSTLTKSLLNKTNEFLSTVSDELTTNVPLVNMPIENGENIRIGIPAEALQDGLARRGIKISGLSEQAITDLYLRSSIDRARKQSARLKQEQLMRGFHPSKDDYHLTLEEIRNISTSVHTAPFKAAVEMAMDEYDKRCKGEIMAKIAIEGEGEKVVPESECRPYTPEEVDKMLEGITSGEGDTANTEKTNEIKEENNDETGSYSGE